MKSSEKCGGKKVNGSNYQMSATLTRLQQEVNLSHAAL